MYHLNSALNLWLRYKDNHTQFDLTSCDFHNFRSSIVDGKALNLDLETGISVATFYTLILGKSLQHSELQFLRL